MASKTQNALAGIDPAVLEAIAGLLVQTGEQDEPKGKGKGKQDGKQAKQVRPENRDALPTGKQFSRLFWKQDGKIADFEVSFKIGRKSYSLSTRQDIADSGLL